MLATVYAYLSVWSGQTDASRTGNPSMPQSSFGLGVFGAAAYPRSPRTRIVQRRQQATTCVVT